MNIAPVTRSDYVSYLVELFEEYPDTPMDELLRLMFSLYPDRVKVEYYSTEFLFDALDRTNPKQFGPMKRGNYER